MSVIDVLRKAIPNGSLLSGLVFGQKKKFVCTNLFQEERTTGEKRYVAEIRYVSNPKYQVFGVQDAITVPLNQIEEPRVLLPRFLTSETKNEQPV